MTDSTARTHLLHGATLIEVTLVVSIIALLTSIAISRAGPFVNSIEVRGSVTEITSMFSLARHVAIARGRQSVIDIDPASGTISIRSGIDTIVTRSVGAAHGTVISTSRTSMTYTPTGVGYGAANFTMTVKRGTVVDTIVVSRLGRVRSD